MDKSAHISNCGQYRYWLRRQWDDIYPPLNFIMLNPSTADAEQDDPTIRRCMGFARREGYGGIVVTNLYAYRATNPRALLAVDDPIGPENDRILWSIAAQHSIIAAWGTNAETSRVLEVLHILKTRNLFALGVTKSGAPRHPLYVRGDAPLVLFNPLPAASELRAALDGTP